MSLGQKFNIDETRGLFGKRLGEIIEGVIGDARVRELFDTAGKHPDEYEGKPTGMIALDLGVITPDTKTALLVAQAAVRTLNAADLAEKALKGENTPEPLSIYDDIFKYVGSDRDAASLKNAQATWQIAEMYHGYVYPGKMNYQELPAELQFSNQDCLDILRASAKSSLVSATKLLSAEGHESAANRVDALASSVYVENDSAYRFPASAIARDVLDTQYWAIKAASEVSDAMKDSEVPQKFGDFVEKVKKLTPVPFSQTEVKPSGPSNDKI